MHEITKYFLFTENQKQCLPMSETVVAAILWTAQCMHDDRSVTIPSELSLGQTHRFLEPMPPTPTQQPKQQWQWSATIYTAEFDYIQLYR